MLHYLPPLRRSLFPKFYIFLFVHLLAVLGLWLYAPTLTLILLFLCLHFVAACLGITLTYHRCFSHRAFRFRYKWMERCFATLGTLAMQQGPIWWTGIHRLHHRYSDTPEDPHNNRRGFWYSHFLWLFQLDPRWAKPYVVNRFEEGAPDLAPDPYYRFLDRFFYLPTLVLLGILFVMGGWPWVFWGGFIRLVGVWHVTWFVNSVTHRWGYRTFDAGPRDTSTNSWWVAIVAYGEGWHNNHHAFPSSAKQGFFRWWEFDFTFLIIRGMEKLGLATQVRMPSEIQVRQTALGKIPATA